MVRSVIVLSTVFALTSSAVYGEDKDSGSKEEVRELRQELQDLRRMVLRLLEIEEQRASGIRSVLNEARGMESSSRRVAGEPADSVEAERSGATVRPSRPAVEVGSVSGRVSVSGPARGPTIFVYIEDLPGRMARDKTVEIKQIEKQFSPQAVAVQKGTRVIFPNHDKIFHNVFSLSPGASFDLGTYRAGDKPGAYVFTQTGVVDVFCNLHSQMNASVLVVPNSSYTKASADGRFQIRDLPPGKHKLVAWTPNIPAVSRSITISANEDAKAEISIAGSGLPPKHTDKTGMPYGSYQ